MNDSNDTVLLGCVRKDELLTDAIGTREIAVEFECVDQCVVGSKDDVGAAGRQRAKRPDQRNLQSSMPPPGRRCAG